MRERGLSLIELMFSLTICMIITAAVFACYIHSNNCMTLQSDIYQLQEEVMTVSDLLTDEIELSGYMGCQRLLPGMRIIGAGRELSVANQLVVTPDSITTRHAAVIAATVVSVALAQLIISDNILFHKNDILLISDCQHAEIFVVKHAYHRANQQMIEPSSVLQHDYAAGAEITYFEENKFFVRQTKRRHENGKAIHALYVENIIHDIRQLIDDVERVQFNIHYHGAMPAGADFSLKIHMNEVEREWLGYAQIMH